MVHLVKVTATLSLIPGADTGWKKRTDSHEVSYDLHMCSISHTHTHLVSLHLQLKIYT